MPKLKIPVTHLRIETTLGGAFVGTQEGLELLFRSATLEDRNLLLPKDAKANWHLKDCQRCASKLICIVDGFTNTGNLCEDFEDANPK